MDMEELNRAVAQIPEESRRVIARWLLAQAEQYRPSMFLDERQVSLIQGVITGAAVDVMDPTSEEVTNAHAARILGSLQD